MARPIARKGIVQYAASFRLFGINLFWLGILYKVGHEGRLREAAISAWYMLQSRFSPVEAPAAHTGIEAHTEILYSFDLASAPGFKARAQSVCSNGKVTVAGEYAWPGARILVRHQDHDEVHDPYADDGGIYHIHAVTHLEKNEFAVTTGDTKKVLDLLFLEDAGRIVRRRKISNCAGYTAMIFLDGNLWGGSDFSERANFLVNISDSQKYFLPRTCLREYFIDIKPIPASRLLVITRRLGTDGGHALIFGVKDRQFVAANAIRIADREIPWEARAM